MTAFTLDVAGALGGPDWLVARRRQAWERFATSDLPTEAEEIWRYSGIDRFDLSCFAPVVGPEVADGTAAAAEASPAVMAEARRLAEPLGPRAALVVTRNGTVVSVEIAADAPGGLVQVTGGGPMARVLAPEVLGLPAEADDGRTDAFDLLHHAYVADVVVVEVGERVSVESPVVVVHLLDAKPTGAEPEPGSDGPVAPAAFPHTLVSVGAGARAGVVEVLASLGSGGGSAAALVVPVSQVTVGENAHLAYANLQMLGDGATHIGLQTSRIAARGELRSFTVSLGGSYARVRTESDLIGEGGRSALLAAYLGTGTQVHDFRTLQDHHAPRTDSELLFTGAVADQARSVYSGLIRIRHGARRADARQTNHNLVLSEGAHADSVPNLDIDENDVKCSHASTVGPIDEEQRYYLESRGIEPAVAERLIVRGYFAELASRSPFSGIGTWIEQAVEQRLIGRLPAEQPDGVLTGPAHG